MKKTLLSALILLVGLSSSAQIITSPFVENSDDMSCIITKVETNNQFTIVNLEYTAGGENSWAQLNKEIFIQTNVNNKHYNYIKSEDIPLVPAKHTFNKAGDKLSFKVYFEKIPAAAKSIDIIERAGGNRNGASYFNFYNVSLVKVTEHVKITHVTIAPPPANEVSSNIVFKDNNMAGMLGAMAPMFSNLVKSMMDAQLEYYQQPGKITEVAKLNKQYFDSLVKEGFNEEQALKIITSEGLLPKATMGGK